MYVICSCYHSKQLWQDTIIVRVHQHCLQGCFILTILGVTVGQQQLSYIVSEDGGQELSVCIILSGQIERDVVVSIGTEDGSAAGG